MATGVPLFGSHISSLSTCSSISELPVGAEASLLHHRSENCVAINSAVDIFDDNVSASSSFAVNSDSIEFSVPTNVTTAHSSVGTFDLVVDRNETGPSTSSRVEVFSTTPVDNPIGESAVLGSRRPVPSELLRQAVESRQPASTGPSGLPRHSDAEEFSTISAGQSRAEVAASVSDGQRTGLSSDSGRSLTNIEPTSRLNSTRANEIQV